MEGITQINGEQATVFHPQTDGATERANRSIAQILRTVVSNDQ